MDGGSSDKVSVHGSSAADELGAFYAALSLLEVPKRMDFIRENLTRLYELERKLVREARLLEASPRWGALLDHGMA
jgi:hypothetical protein